MKQELYINNQRVDLGKSKITLKYISNLFGDITKIAANRSYTIQLPRTEVNEVIFKHSSIIGVATKPTKLNCRYILNGLTIVTDGVAILMRVTMTHYEVAISWGINSILKTIIDNNYLLRDVINNGEYSYAGYDGGTYEDAVNKGYGNPREYGLDFNGSIYEPNKLPIVNFEWLYKKIAQTWGINFVYSQKTKELFRNNWLNITDRERLTDEEDINMKGSTTVTTNQQGTRVTSNLYYNWGVPYNLLRERQVLNNLDEYIGAFECLDDLEVTLSADCTLSNYNGDFELYYYGGDVNLGQEQFDLITEATSSIISPTLKRATIPSITRTFKKGQCFTLYTNAYGSSIGSSTTNITFSSIKVKKGKVNKGMLIKVVPNLPKCTITNFIKDSLMLFNLYPIYKNNDTIEIINLQDIINKKDRASNYSDNLIKSDRELNFDFTIFAQDTKFSLKPNKYTEFDMTESNSGYLKIENILAPKKGDVNFTEFTMARGEIKKYERKDGIVTDVDLPTTVLCTTTIQNLINTHYKTLAQILKAPKVIKVDVSLSLFEVQNFDYTKPIYLKQYGAYFAVISMTAQGNKYNLELLKIS